MIRHLLRLNGLAVLAAIGQHASGWGFTALFWWTDRYLNVVVPDFSQQGQMSYCMLRVAEQLTIFGPPAFLFVSGVFVAFAAGRDGTGFGWLKASTRVRTLFIPYVVWSLVILLARAAEGSIDTTSGYLRTLLFGKAAEPYYYVPLVTQFFLLAPLIVLSMRTHWRSVLVGAGLLQLATQLARYPAALNWDVPVAVWLTSHTPGWLLPQTAFWFVFGVFAGFRLPELKNWLTWWQRYLLWGTAALALLAFVEWELLLRLSGKQWLGPFPTVFDSLYSLSFILTFMAYAPSTVRFRRQLDGLGERSFGVYLMHAPILEFASRALYHVGPFALGHQLLFQSVLIAAGIAIPLLIMAAVDRSPARPSYNYLFG